MAARETQIGEFETAGELAQRLKGIGAQLLVETVCRLEAGEVTAEPQDENAATYTKMLDKSLCPIDWTRTPREIVKHICGLDPWPVATAELQGQSFRVLARRIQRTLPLFPRQRGFRWPGGDRGSLRRGKDPADNPGTASREKAYERRCVSAGPSHDCRWLREALRLAVRRCMC